MSGLMCIVFISFQILPLLESSQSNGLFLNEEYALRILHADRYPDQRPQKCCTSETQIYSYIERKCVTLSNNETQIDSQIHQLLPFLNLTSTFGCAKSIILNELAGQNYTLLENGMLYENLRDQTNDHDHFCFDLIREYKRFMPMVCFDISEIDKSASSAERYSNNPESPKSTLWRKQYLYILGLSNLFLIITLFSYLILPELHHNEFDWSLMCHIASLIIGFFCLIADSYVTENDVFCVPLAYLRQFSMLSSFCWLNVMGLYLWYATIPQKFSGTFHIVCLYAFGFPVFVSIVTFLTTKLNTFDGFINPGFEKSCWFLEHDGNFWVNPKFIYFYNIIFMIMTMNFGLFVSIAFKILFLSPGWKPTVYRDEQRYDLLHMRILLCLKLFFIMGLSWTAEMMSFLVEQEELKWRLKNLAVLLHGIFIFIIFAGNDRVLSLLLKRSSVSERFKSLHDEKKVVFIADKTNAIVIVR